jgi:uncharacterized membrane protein
MMQSVIDYLKLWQPHPFVDHFTVALILLGIVTDLVASIFSARLWIRYMALALMIVGAIGAACSYATGGWEADRVWDLVKGPGKTVLERHAWWGGILPWVFGGLALWRLGLQFIGFLAVSRPLYLLAAIIGGALIVYQGHLGGVMVYDYGVGTALLPASQTTTSSPLPSPTIPPPVAANPGAAASLLASPIPSIAPTTTPNLIPSTPAPVPTPSIPAPPSTTATPSPAPSISSALPINPTPAEAPSPDGAGAKNL